MTEQLRNDALAFIESVESIARDEGYQVAKKEFDAKLAEQQAAFDKAIVEARETYYNNGFEEGTIPISRRQRLPLRLLRL